MEKDEIQLRRLPIQMFKKYDIGNLYHKMFIINLSYRLLEIKKNDATYQEEEHRLSLMYHLNSTGKL